MIKQTHIFFLQNNSYLFFKNYFVFYFILKKISRKRHIRKF